MNKKTIIIICVCAAAAAAVLYFCQHKKTAPSAVSPSASPTASAETSESASPSPSAAGSSKAVDANTLSTFKTLLNENGNYGFLLSQYTDVRDADLAQVFYTGAGIAPASDAGSIVAAYKAAMADGATETDGFVLKTAQIDSFLKEKTGYTHKDMRSALDWEYDPQHDAYLCFRGDTNKIGIIPVTGKALGDDRYALTCTFDGSFYDASAGEAAGCIATFTYKNGKIVFLSNQFTR